MTIRVADALLPSAPFSHHLRDPSTTEPCRPTQNAMGIATFRVTEPCTGVVVLVTAGTIGTVRVEWTG